MLQHVVSRLREKYQCLGRVSIDRIDLDGSLIYGGRGFLMNKHNRRGAARGQSVALLVPAAPEWRLDSLLSTRQLQSLAR